MDHCSGLRSQGPNRTEDGVVQFIRSPPLQPLVERFAYFGASLTKLDVFLIVGHRVLENVSKRIVFGEMGESYLDHSEEGARGSEGDLGRWNTAGVLGDVQSLDEDTQRFTNTIAPFLLLG